VDVIPRWVERYCGIPFAENGSTKEACNCWGLCALVLSERANVEVDRYAHIVSTEGRRIAKQIAQAQGEYVSVLREADVREFDLVVMKPMGRGIPWHIGIMVSSTHVLHIEEDAESSCVPLSHDLIKPRLVSFHRHPKLA
jgi:cell wall-associated NlpC family hydrolase